MNKSQWVLITLGFLLFVGLFFGFDTKPSKHKVVEKQREIAAVSTDISSLLIDAKAKLDAGSMATVQTLEAEVLSAKTDSAKVELLKKLAGVWYNLQNPSISGHYAEEVAAIDKSEDAWAIAGTTYSICVGKENDERIKNFCTERAIQTLENAASLNPANLQHKVNLALIYAENPPADNPMKGVLMLIELNDKNPKNPLILTQLGRLAIKTGQYEKAVERLQEALAVDPDNQKAVCFIAQAYEELGDTANAEAFQKKCEKLSGR